jgi:hypothetical protein
MLGGVEVDRTVTGVLASRATAVVRPDSYHLSRHRHAFLVIVS